HPPPTLTCPDRLLSIPCKWPRRCARELWTRRAEPNPGMLWYRRCAARTQGSRWPVVSTASSPSSRCAGGMADRHGERVGDIFGFELVFEPCQHTHHPFHLMLFGAAIADHAGFYFQRRIFP